MIPLTARQIAELVGGRVAAGNPELVYRAAFTDSRALAASTGGKPVRGGSGALFVALRGETFDGHDFIPDAFAAGAQGVIASQPVPPHDPWPVPEQEPVWIEVADTQRALESLARGLRDFHPGRVVAVTGSVGKTTVKDMIAAALAEIAGGAEHVLATPGNLNNHIGLPLTLAQATGREQYLVLELGMSAPGEIAALAHIARPEIGLVTRAAAAHLAFFPSVDAIADAKAELFGHLGPSAIAVVNADDARMLARSARPRPSGSSKTLTYGAAPGAEVRILEATQDGDGVHGEVATPTARVVVSLDAVGLHMLHNAVGALAVVHALGLDVAVGARGIQRRWRPGKHRLERLTLGKGTAAVRVLDDCYNANPASMRAALDAFAGWVPAGAVKVAVLGSMRELGPEADALHRDLGLEAARRGIRRLFVTGPHAHALAEGARAGGVEAAVAEDVKFLVDAIAAAAEPGSWLLLKGSRGERLERVIDTLRAAHGEVG